MDPRTAYRETAVQGASPLRLVVLLYEQAIQDLQRAMAAMAEGSVERRTQEINHALAVVGQLQGSLNMERGGEVARNLDRFYSVLRASLQEAQARVSPEILRKQVANLLTLRETWTEVERAIAAPALRPQEQPGQETARQPQDWTG